MIERGDRHAAEHRLAAKVIDTEEIACKQVLHLIAAVLAELKTAHGLNQLIGGDDHDGIAALKHALRDAVHQERFSKTGTSAQQQALSITRGERVGIIFAVLAALFDEAALRTLAPLDRLIREDAFVKRGKVLFFKPLQPLVLIQTIQHRALQARAHLVHRLADIARIPAGGTAIHRLQVILRQAAGGKRRAQVGIDMLHLRLHRGGDFFCFCGRSKRTAHAGEEQPLPLHQQLGDSGAFRLRLGAAALLLHQVFGALRLQIRQRFARYIFTAEHRYSSSSKSSTAAL